MRRSLVLLVVLAGCERRGASTLPEEPIRAVPAGPVTLELDEERMHADLTRLADDGLAGRHSGDKIAIVAAANIIANSHREAGLAPVGPKYLVDFDLVVGQEPADDHHLWIDVGGDSVNPEDDAFVSIAFGNRVAVGNALFVAKSEPATKLAGSIVVILAGADWKPDELKARLAALAHAGATGAIVVGNAKEALPNGKQLAAELEGVELSAVFVKHEIATALTVGGKPLATAARKQKKPTALDSARISLARRLRSRLATVPNVLATLPGSDLADEIVILGAHYDHIGTETLGVFCRDPPMRSDPGDEVCNGADDNASGTAMVMAVARAMATSAFKPRRTVVFAHFAGEELGLHGSRALVEHPPKAAPFEGGKVVAMVNLDMVGRLGDKGLEIGGAGTSEAWIPLLDSLRPDGVDVHYTRTVSPRSDHANYHRAGVPVLFFFTGLHEDYHRTSDELDRINREGMAMIGAMVLQLGQKLAEGEPIPPATRVSASRARRRPPGSPR